MDRQIKFTLGNLSEGYKTVEISIDGDEATYKILRSGLLNVDKKNFPAAKVSDDWFNRLDALNIFAWDKNYSAENHDGFQWELLFKDEKKIYRGHGAAAYPEGWAKFLDLLDEIVPELEFVNRKQLEKITLNYSEEELTLDRKKKTLTIDKKFSTHTYNLDEEIKELFDTAQKIFEDVEIEEADSDCDLTAKFELVFHDGSVKIFETPYTENFLPGLMNFTDEIQACADDLTAKIFSPAPNEIVVPQGKYIFCKVQFSGTYKHYTYQTDDEKLSVGDIVDVPVGKNNDVTQAKIVEIGYFDEYEAPFPVDRIKKIIGKHIADDWENY